MKLQFVTCGHADHYEALQMTVLNRAEGTVDSLLLRFSDLFGKKRVNNPNFPDGIDPHIWVYYGKADWYAYQPTKKDYAALGEAAERYLTLFRSPEMEQGQRENHALQHQQTMSM